MALKLPNKNKAHSWVNHWKRHTAQVEGPREPTPIERLAAAGYTRRMDRATGEIWFENADGVQTPRWMTLELATQEALRAIGAI